MTDRDPSIGADGLTRHDRELIRDVLARYPEVRRVTLFGSRAMGTFGRGSDIDLALEGPDLDARTLTRIATELEDSDLPYKVDLLLRDEQLDPKLEAHIRRHGKPLRVCVSDSEDFTTSDSHWRSLPFSQAVAVNPTVRLERGGVYPFVDMNAVDPGRPVVHPAEEREFTGGGSRFESGDTLFARITPCLENGKIARFKAVGDDNRPAHGSTEFIVMRGRNGVSVTDFVFYLARSPKVRGFAIGQMTGSSGRQRVPTDCFGKLNILLPPRDEQRAIAGVLGALDDKIEQNRRTARALERLARAIFRAWFVDFEPVKAKAAGATAFPSMPQAVFDALPTRFVESEIGPVPEGWAVKAITQVATFLNGLALQKYPPRGDGEDLRVIKIAELRKGSAEGADWANGDVPEQYVIDDRDLLFSWSGTLEVEFWFGGKGALNQHLFKVTSSHFPSWFCFHWIRQHLPWFRAIAASKATTMGHIKRGHLQETRVVVPPNDVLREAHGVIGSIYDVYSQLMIESRKLAAMRDYLLPKLLSGEVRASEPAKFSMAVA